MFHRWLRTFSVVLAAALSVVGCNRAESESPFVTVKAEIGDVRDSVPATGTLIAAGASEIRSTRAGVVAAVHVKEGERVRAGQVLATLTAPTRDPSREEAVATAASANAAVREAVVVARGAEEKLARSRTLQEKGFVSAAAVRTAAAEVERAQASYERLSSESAAARARLRRTSAEGAVSDVVAPLDGVVSLATARVGQRVTPDDEQPMFQTGQDIRDLTLEILISEADLARVSMASQVAFTVDAYPGVTESATLTSIGSAPIREGRFVSYRALAKVNNFAEVMKPGMSASVQLIRANSRNVLRVPIAATYFKPRDYTPPLPPQQMDELIRREHGNLRIARAGAYGLELRRLLTTGTRIIFVLIDGEPVRREVRIGAETDEFVEVTEGLKPGEAVILKDSRDPRNAV